MITLNVEAFEQVQTELVKPKLFNKELYKDHVLNEIQKTDLLDIIWDRYEIRFQNALQSKNLQEAHMLLCNAMEELIFAYLPDSKDEGDCFG